MLISSRGRYALLVMIDLAGHRGGLVPGRQIAERLGFCDQFYLSRFFSARMGMPPSEYRARLRSQL